MHTFSDRDYSRSPGFLHPYREEAQRMSADTQRTPTTNAKDETVLLPILLLLMTESADKWLLLALLYILM